jgi:hypothetical protein
MDLAQRIVALLEDLLEYAAVRDGIAMLEAPDSSIRQGQSYALHLSRPLSPPPTIAEFAL